MAPNGSANAIVSSTPGYAGFWRRLAAFSLDAVLLYLVFTLVTSLPTTMFASAAQVGPYQAGKTIGYVFAPMAMIGSLLYWSLMESSSRQASLGKMALGIVVVDAAGRRLSFGRALGRNVGKGVLAFAMIAGIGLIGFLLAAFTRRRQAFHDLMADCLVVRREQLRVPAGEPTASLEAATTLPWPG